MSRVRRIEPKISLRWIQLGQERVPSMRDFEGKLLYPYNEYLDSLSSSLHEKDIPARTIRSHVDAATYALKGFAQYLADSKQSLTVVNDKVLVSFRKHALKLVRASPQARDKERTAKQTVNVKLKEVYKFLAECQKAHRLPPGTIGPVNCLVTSTLPLKLIAATREGAGLNEIQLYPKCYTGLGNGRIGDTGQYWATDKDVDALEDYFWRKNRNTHTALRNILMMRLGEQLSWRISSINSLEAAQFSQEELRRQSDNDAFCVTPPFQKLGREDTFTIRWELAHEVARFISEDRAQHLVTSGSTERVANGRVFLSARGAPLSDHYAVEILADAFKAIAATGRSAKGRGSHALRRKSGTERMRDEIAFRRANGLSLAQEDVERAVQPHLGHGSVLSQRVYSKAITELRSTSQEELLQRRVLEKQLANDKLRRQLKERDDLIAELMTKQTSRTTKRRKPPAARKATALA